MAPVLDRIFSRWQRTGRWGVPLAAVFAIFALLALLWLRPGPVPSEAAQETTSRASPSSAFPSAASPPTALDGLESILDDASASAAAEEETDGIPGLGAVEVTGNLEHAVADETFPCDGPSPDGDLVLWSCAHPSGGYAVEVVGDDPLTVFSVTAAARGLPERDAEAFFGYVLDLCLEEEAALDPEAWASGSVPSGGRTFSDGVKVSVYGSEKARAMSVVSTDAKLD
jgi:hypothetical protein